MSPTSRRRRLVIAVLLAAVGLLGLIVAVVVEASDALALARAGRDLVRETDALARRAGETDQRTLLASLPASRWNGSYVLLEDLLAEAETSVSTLGPLPPLLAFEFETDDVRMTANGAASRQTGGALRLDGDRDIYLRAGGLELATKDVGDVEIRLRVRRGKRLWLSWLGEDLESWPHDPRGPCCLRAPWNSSTRRLIIDLVPDGRFHTYSVDGSKLIGGMTLGVVRTLFLHPTDTDDEVEIDYLRFHSRLAAFARTGLRHGPATQGRDTRSTIGCLAPCSLAFRAPVPRLDPRLDLGYAILDDDHYVGFEVAIGGSTGERALSSEWIGQTGAWTDRRFDLSPWAGETVTLRLSATAPGAGAVGFWSNPVVFGRPERRFNVLMVVEDTLRADHLSVYGHRRRTSPVKERLAASGVAVEHAFSQAPATRPSVPSYMTSLYPGTTGVWTFQHWLGERYLTLAEVLRSQGFATASFLENVNAGVGAGLAQGFEHVFFEDWQGGSEGLYADHLPRWLAAHGDRNWFVYAHVIDPHGPYDPPAPWDHWYREEGPGSTAAKPSGLDADWVTQPTREGRQRLYDGEIERNDHYFGRLLAWLETAGLRRDTLVVFMSDHGEHFGEHSVVGDEQGLYSHYSPTYGAVTRVPLLLSWPGVLPEGVRIAGTVPLLDVMPTILDLARIDRSSLTLQGRSLMPALATGRVDRDRIVFSEEPERFHDRDHPAISSSIFFRDWHLVASRRLSRWERYDLVTDPQESTPLRGRGRLREALIDRVAARLLRRFADAQVSLRRELAGAGPEEARYDPAEMERLRALGYLD